MSETSAGTPRPIRLSLFVAALSGFWTMAIVATLAWELSDERGQAVNMARAEANGVLERELSFLRWYGMQGGIYGGPNGGVRAAGSPANVEPRGADSSPVSHYRLIQHPDLTRQLRQFATGDDRVLTRLSGPRPIRPENSPDGWEKEALEALAGGEPEVAIEAGGNSRDWVMRVMRPLPAERECLKCHERQGFREGELIGGISVSVPVDTPWLQHRDDSTRRIVGYGGMWVFGLGVIFVGGFFLGRQIEGRRLAGEQLHASKAQMLAAQRIQEHLLPSAPPELAGFAVAGASSPAEFAGGDYFDYLRMADGQAAFVIGDVCGHGVGPALLMASTQTLLRSLAKNEIRPSVILASANRFLNDLQLEDNFVTLFLGRIEGDPPCFRYASAGHPTGYILAADGSLKARLESTGPPLGCFAEAEFGEGGGVPVAPGDLILLLTDGIEEAQSAEDEPFGVDRLLRAIRAYRDRPVAEILALLFRAVREFSGREKPLDDITAIVIKSDGSREG